MAVVAVVVEEEVVVVRDDERAKFVRWGRGGVWGGCVTSTKSTSTETRAALVLSA